MLLFHLFLVHGLLLRCGARLPFGQLVLRFREALLVALGTSSRNATLPVTFDVRPSRNGVSRSVAALPIPLGATINIEGTAIIQRVATVFVAQRYDVPLGWATLLHVVAMATLASLGTADVPGVGREMLTMVFR